MALTQKEKNKIEQVVGGLRGLLAARDEVVMARASEKLQTALEELVEELKTVNVAFSVEETAQIAGKKLTGFVKSVAEAADIQPVLSGAGEARAEDQTRNSSPQD